MAPLTDRITQLQAAIAQRYRLVQEAGQGGMATVYLTDDLRHRRAVALKVLRPEFAAAIGPERFLQEILTTASLRHPHILPLYDSGEAADCLFYVMPFVEGESLRARLDREPQLPVDEALRLTREVAEALDYAHERGVIHRDIKPENILLERGHAVVADFGIARALSTARGPRLTQSGLIVGTPAYMSPEQAAGEPDLDGRSDQYSLACVLQELLTGSPPFTGPTAQAVMARRFTDAPPPVRGLRPAVPVAVEQALLRALAGAPEDRFPTCGAFVAAFARAAEAAAAAATPALAVLPFLNLSPDPANEFFADGVTEDVIAQLSKIRSLKVISRSSTARFTSRERDLPAIGRALGVAHLVEGSVRRAGEQVRIVAQLVDASSNQHRWSETYDRRLTDIFAIQSDVALQITTALAAELRPQERARLARKPTASPQAYQAYLKGRACYIKYTQESIEKGIEYFREAIALDPGYAMAHTGIALAYAELAAGQGGGDTRPEDAYVVAIAAVNRALELDEELGEAHAVRALLLFTHDFDWAGAEREFKRALELSPSSADIYDHYGWFCGALDRYDEALALVTRAQELDPLTHRSDVATTLLRAGRYAEALAAAQQSVEFDPEHARGLSTLGWSLIFTGQAADGLAVLERASSRDPDNTMFLAQLGQAHAMVGDRATALRIAGELEAMAATRYVSPYHLAYVYTGLGDTERALDLLERAYAERAGSVYGLKGSFLFHALRPHPRFRALLARMNL